MPSLLAQQHTQVRTGAPKRAQWPCRDRPTDRVAGPSWPCRGRRRPSAVSQAPQRRVAGAPAPCRRHCAARRAAVSQALCRTPSCRVVVRSRYSVLSYANIRSQYTVVYYDTIPASSSSSCHDTIYCNVTPFPHPTCHPYHNTIVVS